MDVSIIIPTYNRLWSLKKAVSSCFDTKLKIEVLVIDDGSTDGTAEWLKQQPNILFFQQANRGKDWAINNFFRYTQGKYIRFLDSDDWLLPSSTHLLFEEAELKNADVVAAGNQVYTVDEKLIRTNNWVINDDFIAQQLGETDSSHYSAYLFKKDFISDIPHRQEFGARDDRQFIIEVALKNPITSYIESPTLAHRMHQNERLQNFKASEAFLASLATLKIYKMAFKLLSASGQLTQRRKNAGIKMLWPVSHWLAKDNIMEGKSVYNWIKELDPNFIIPDKGFIGFCYRTLGFSATEKLLKIRRILLKGIN
ncbi:glycosyltransferase family 2 protein [Pedobacter fastidiosus]|uniref:Glycosyltransferase family 2 protein n=1 Tax=Pedobacter fastidiosus TaxID=2765361 RepID=A0ABR7KWN3_9SPHI|nr:glycosyltransferase family 2 protein [Pedobacter fastidiosus]MBC6112162.1 glycosyltransferase family 2 protein [Pedobacter fastidiosus]